MVQKVRHHRVTKVSKQHDVKHEEQESVGSLKIVVELTSDRVAPKTLV